MNDNPRVLGNRYEVGDLLGRGGMAEVHLGRDTRLGRVVAIKLLRVDLARDPIFQARFRREAQSAASLNHPAIVAVYDTGEEQLVDAAGSLIALPYIVMEYVEGRTLRELLRDGRPLDLGQALELTSGVLSALEYSHRAGIVHRDIKPANVMLTPDGDVKVMDFGIARALADVSTTMTATQAVIGTAQYLSPEQARGETVDARSDLYSAGCLLFELVTGRPPFVADSPVAVAYQHVREAPPLPSSLNPAIPESLDRVVLHSLAKDRETRYQNAAEFRADLENVRSGRAVSAPAMAVGGTRPVEHPGAYAPTEALSRPAGQAGPTRPLTTQLPPPPTGYGSGYDQGYDNGYSGYDAGYAGGQATAGFPDPQLPGYDDNGRDAKRGAGRNVGYVLLGLVVVAVFAAVAYLAYTMLGSSIKQVAVPPVKGLTRAEAIAKVRESGLTVTSVEQASDTVPADTVIDQNPAGGVRIDQGSAVTLTISTGSSTVQVPDVKDMTREQAEAELKKVGLTVAGTKSVDNVKVDKDKVAGTDPKATKPVAKGSGVTLLISSGMVDVPDVTGKSLTEAQAILNDLNLNVNVVPEPSDQPEGTVIRQEPAKGEKLQRGSGNVTLHVAAAQTTPTDTPPTETPTDGGSPEATPTPS
ncbi:MAG: Stk1 family PASTA domain-containing Ser/Thr kinase [Kineosporiaceae bacterium]